MHLSDNITTLKGIGPKMKEELNKCDIHTLLDFILYFPRDYEKSSYCNDINNVIENEKVIIKAKVKTIKRDIYIKKNMIISIIVFEHNGVTFEGKWFNQTYIKKKFRTDSEYMLKGKFQEDKYKKTLVNPIIIDNYEENCTIMPKYSLKGKLTNKFVVKEVLYILSNIKIKENISCDILEKYNLISLDNAIRNIHKPSGEKELKESIKRLKFQELFTYSLKLLMLKQYNNFEGIAFKISDELKNLKENIPFKLTEAQNRVIREILIDEKKKRTMNRLVQGDVGSGKTIVALIALFNIIKNGYQGILIAPTEILACQHYEEAKKMFENFKINIGLLTGSITSKNKKIIKQDLKNGKVDIIIGTHAILEDDVEFYNLGMAVTDEQHRFGVKQRSEIYNKNKNIDVLAMSATPIPRTLALSLYGDLNVSTIDKLPPGRKKVDTYSVKENMRNRVYNFALKEINNGAQIYIVCPLVEENENMKITSLEKLYSSLKKDFLKDIETEILYGKMPSKDKDKIMNKFKKGETKVLICTTVIEVGVNVPNATLMIIESAERFGLSQLHQLRGRVGRGDKKSYCILINNSKNEITKKRMDIMTKSNDGFFIAEEDLKLRGMGDIFGLNQHGEDGLIIANLIEDFDLFKLANDEAQILMNSNKREDVLIKKHIIEYIEKTARYICFN